MDVMQIWPQLLTAACTIVWAVRVEGKVKTLEALNESQMTDIKERLTRIETKLDRANGTA